MLSCINGSKSLPKVSKIVKKLPCKVETVIVVDYLSNVYPSSYPARFLTAYLTKVTAHKPIPALTDTRYILGRSLVHRWANSERQAFTARTNLDSSLNITCMCVTIAPRENVFALVAQVLKKKNILVFIFLLHIKLKP